MAPTSGLKKVEIDLHVRSEHPSLPAPAAVDEIRAFAPEISRRLKAKYGEGRVDVERQKTFPVDPLSILITIGIYVGLKAADKLIQRITEDVYDMVKEKLSAASVTKAGKHRTSIIKHP
jgi:hypothetical protein